uniref:acyl carrier protein n=1 Tax=Vacuolaria virescens TaxID=44451 RepID=UPI002113A219|nr:acyl carrier protein [Vacuolaria virescens]UTE94654.1 acyl carrier protein [Vacuolaria virescens]
MTTLSFPEILLKVRAIVLEQFCLEAEELDNEADFIRDLGADSLDVVELVMTLEEKFGVQITEENTVKIHTVYEAAEIVAQILKLKPDNE